MGHIRLMCSHAVQQQLPITQLDIASAYLYGDIDTVIYMKQPPGFIGQENHVCKLLKSIYGLNQSGFIWHNLLKNTILEDSNYSQSSLDPCLFYADNRNFILIYVDDILLVGSNSVMRNKIQTKFTTHDLGNIQQFLNVKFERTEHSISISQENFILQLLKSYNLQDINPKKTPMLKLELDESPFLPDNLKYTQLVGSLIYLTTVSRPDIAYCVIYLARQSSKPTERNWNQLKHLLAYLKSTENWNQFFRRKRFKIVCILRRGLGRGSEDGKIYVRNNCSTRYKPDFMEILVAEQSGTLVFRSRILRSRRGHERNHLFHSTFKRIENHQPTAYSDFNRQSISYCRSKLPISKIQSKE